MRMSLIAALPRQYARFSANCRVALIAAVSLCFVFTSASAQSGATVFGDLTVDESKVEGSKPLSYDLILYYLDGRVVGRQKVANGGRYRFMGVRSGEYDIVVEMDNQEVARIRVHVSVIAGGADVRRDIELEWKPNASRGGNLSRKQTVSAEDFYERPAAMKANFEKAQNALDKKNYSEAVSLFKVIVDADPKDFQAWTELGTAYLLQDRHRDAEKSYQRAVNERPTFFLALLNLGRVRSLMKDFEGAAESLTRAVESQPTSAEANLLLGETYLQLKKGSKAVTHLNSAANLGRPEAHLRLATLYNAAGLKDKAAAEYEEFLKKRPDYPDRKKLEKYIAENGKK